MEKNITIKDIAIIAKVSPTAVSMAINNRPGVSKKTQKDILQIAKKLKYRPNYIAKSLISKRSYSIGLIVNSIADPFYPELASGIQEKADELGYSLILCNTRRSLEVEKRSIDMLRSKGVDGLILVTVTVDDPHIKPLVEERFPFVLINRLSLAPFLQNKMDYVVVDNYAGGYLAVEHLYKLGHDRIAIIAGALNTSTAIQRTEGARKALLDYGVRQDSTLVVECGYIRQKAYEATKKLISKKNRPTAFFAQDDYMALGVREAVLGAGLRIPEDIAIMGFDNIEMGSLTGVELTTISQNKYEMGVMGVKILIDKIEKTTQGVVNKVVLEAKLIKRKTCGFHLYGYCR